MRKIVFAITILLLASGAQAANDASSILACMRGNVPAGPMVSKISVTTHDPGTDAEQTLSGQFYVAREQAKGASGAQLWAMLRVMKPEHLAGAAYLVREVNNKLNDEMFVYLPAVGRVRRITGSFANKPLLGTTFSYFDFKQIWNAFGDLVPVALSETTKVNGRSAYVLHFHTQPETRISYSKVAVWVDQKTCVPIRADFIRDDEVLKRMTVPKGAIEHSETHWYPARIRMRDLVNNLVSVMHIKDLRSLEEDKGALFAPDAFYKWK